MRYVDPTSHGLAVVLAEKRGGELVVCHAPCHIRPDGPTIPTLVSAPQNPDPPPLCYDSGMATREHVETWEEMEVALSQLSDEAWEGHMTKLVMAALDDLAARLPHGYIIEGGFIVRLDPSLPDHVTVAQKFNGQVVGQVTLPAR